MTYSHNDEVNQRSKRKKWFILGGALGVLILVVLVVVLVVVLRDQDPEPEPGLQSRLVSISSGNVRGYKEGDLYAFYNIPYATAPTGDDKFKAPLPAPQWESTFEATGSLVGCLQPLTFNSVDQREDCLITHVYVPDTEEMNLPVVVSIHGGAYQVGMAGPPPHDFMANKNFIYVTFNYRLHTLGFLCLGTERAPGNAGLKDQVALLRWVQENIASFGGNPDHVTISGCSAGGTSVDLLTISKTARGLFKYATAESGSNVAAWSVYQNPINAALNYARKMNYTGPDDVNAVEEFYITTPIEELFQDLETDGFSNPDTSLFFGPCVERDVGEEMIIHDAPFNIIRLEDYDKIPFYFGFNNKEGIFMFSHFEQYSAQMNEQFSDFLPADLQFSSNEDKEEVAQRVKQFYFGDATVGVETLEEYVEFMTDTMFAYAVVRSARMRAQTGSDSVYLYEYSFGTHHDLPGHEGVSVIGATHCEHDDLMLSNHIDPNDTNLFEMVKVMREIFHSFALTGRPQPEGISWDAIDVNGSPLVVLNSSLSVTGPAMGPRAQLWDSIYETHYRQPQPPPAPPSRT